MIYKLAIFLAFLMLLSFSDACANMCKGITITSVPGCTLTGRGCKCVQLFKKAKYKVDLTDPVSGVSAGSDYHGDDTTAGKVAIVNLFNNDHHNGCTCKPIPDIPFGSCTLAGRACFYFPNLNALNAKTPSFSIWIHNTAAPSVEGNASAASEKDVQAAAQAAIQDLNAKSSLAHCGHSLESAEHAELFEQHFIEQIASYPEVDFDNLKVE